MKNFVLVLFLILTIQEGLSLVPASDHFNGHVFNNVPSTKHKTLWDVLLWRWNRVAPIELNLTQDILQAKPQANIMDDNIAVTFVGHATFLLQAREVNVLTDPIWSDRCSPVAFIGPKRLRKPGIDFRDLPRIDVVIISHNHYDHMDIKTLVEIYKRDRPLFVVPLKNRATLADAGITNILEQDWWQTVAIKNGVTITTVPAKHWSGRFFIDRNKSLWSGFVISFQGKNVFFAGDTGFGPHFTDIKKRFLNFELALLPIGAYLPISFMQDHHMSPAEAIRASAILGAKYNIPMHFGTFALGDDGFFLAEKELSLLQNHQKNSPFTILSAGDAFRSEGLQK